jgi:hypothetical protein
VGRTRSEALGNLRALVRRSGEARDEAALHLRRVLERHGQRTLERSDPVEVRLSSGSRIVARNGGVLRCVRYPGLAGLFRKDEAVPWRFGRSMCDRIRREFASGGFFTTDELPGYGLGPGEVAAIREATGAGPRDAATPFTSISQRCWCASIVTASPGFTSREFLTGWPLTSTRPRSTASAASERDLTNRAHQSHLSMRCRASASKSTSIV